MNDLRFAIKSLRRSGGFTLIAIITLALGIGANTSMFGLLNNIFLRPSPYPGSDRLDRIYRVTPQNARGGVAPADYVDLKSETAGYGEVAAYAFTDMSLSQAGRPAEMVLGARVSANLFPTLGKEPLLGRSFRPDEEIFPNHRVVVISHAAWQDRFGADAGIIGRTVRVDGEAHEIVGVLGDGFSDWRHLGRVELYRPLGLDKKEIEDRQSAWIRIVGRRAATLDRAQAGAFVADFGRRLAKDHPAVNAESTWRAIPLGETLLPAQASAMLVMLVGLSAFVLLIACSNLANLLLARTIARAREFALRAALGASRSQVLRPLVFESLLLAVVGGLCSLLVAQWTLDWLATFDLRGESDFRLQWRAIGWAFGACLVTALAFGIAPALFAHRLDLNRTLKSGARGSTGDLGHRRFRNGLIVGQFALAMVLLAGAGLFVRGLRDLNDRRFGWESDHLITGTIVLPPATYSSDGAITDLYRRALERVEALPGVRSASLSYSMPFFTTGETRKYVVSGRETAQPGREPAAAVNGVSPRYFESVGTRVLSGRGFEATDTATSPKVFIVNEAMARGLFPGESPLGRRIAQAGGQTAEWGEIVGVVADVESVYADRTAVRYQLYQPITQEPRRVNELAVRTAGVTPSSLIDAIRTTMMSIDADLPVRQLQSADDTVARANYGWDIVGKVLTALAALGLGLASLGIYGVISRTTVQRTAEFGIRLALGAQTRDIARLVLGSGARLAIVGSAIGLLGAFALSRLFATAFPGMQTDSVTVLIGSTVLLIVIAQAACYIPARYASRVSPTEPLRAE